MNMRTIAILVAILAIGGILLIQAAQGEIYAAGQWHTEAEYIALPRGKLILE